MPPRREIAHGNAKRIAAGIEQIRKKLPGEVIQAINEYIEEKESRNEQSYINPGNVCKIEVVKEYLASLKSDRSKHLKAYAIIQKMIAIHRKTSRLK